eukprot:COSAG02_NODE_65648_length_257_cov_0.981013_1_plen_22_part_10
MHHARSGVCRVDTLGMRQRLLT